jgi:DHA2 family multidrug resistance protein-like MFS transporter
VAIYRSGVSEGLPAGVPDAAAAAARDTLGGAAGVAAGLPPELGGALLAAAQDAFVDGMQVVFILTFVLSLLLAVVAVLGLRHVGPTSSESLGADAAHGTAADTMHPPAGAPAPARPEPAREA